jgi:predicted HD phosphohydrolase
VVLPYRYGCAGDFASYQDLSKVSAWTDSASGAPSAPTASIAGIPYAWISWDCSWTGYSICE